MELNLSEAAIEQLAIAAPRYTSYPTADRFSALFSPIDYLQGVYRATFETDHRRPLSIYLHVPFCVHACFYCACNKITTRDKTRSEAYLASLLTEIEHQGRLYRHAHQVVHIHLGGGTPSFLSDDQIEQLLLHIERHFSMGDSHDQDRSIEIDPRTVDKTRLQRLHKMGFKRLSFGIQDTEPRVQQAIGRVQSNDLIAVCLAEARQAGFESISLDLIYGLPFQTVQTHAKTLTQVLHWKPDRLSFFNYAHLPSRFAAQRRIDEARLPSASVRLQIMQQIIHTLTQAGYIHVGLDHFAKPETALAQAEKEGNLYRNFQGYSTHADIDLLGIGSSAISQIGDIYAQNHSDIGAYQQAIDSTAGFAIYRGLRLTQEDLLRRAVIQSIMCQYKVDFNEFNRRFIMDFQTHFSADIAKLSPLIDLGLIQISPDSIVVPPAARLFLRHVAAAFDSYLGQVPSTARYSATL